MKKIKSKIIIITLCTILFTGCSITDIKDDNDKIKVVATIFPGYDFTKAIAEELVDVSMLLKSGAEAHSFEPSPQDVINIQNADLFIYTGGESDEWVDYVLESMDKPINTLKMIDCVSSLESDEEHEYDEEHNHEDKHSEEETHEGTEYDEHIWTSPKNAIKISEKIEEALSNIDKEHTNDYQQNLNRYIEKLEKLDNDFADFFNGVSNRTLVFGDRFPFRYLANDYNLKYHAAYTGCSTDVEPSVSTMASLIDIVNTEKISTVFYIEFSNQKVAQSIAEATGANTMLLHSCHNVSKEELQEGVTYISLMENNLETLMEAMK